MIYSPISGGKETENNYCPYVSLGGPRVELRGVDQHGSI